LPVVELNDGPAEDARGIAKVVEIDAAEDTGCE
jgi:hypothetical protein